MRGVGSGQDVSSTTLRTLEWVSNTATVTRWHAAWQVEGSQELKSEFLPLLTHVVMRGCSRDLGDLTLLATATVRAWAFRAPVSMRGFDMIFRGTKSGMNAIVSSHVMDLILGAICSFGGARFNASGLGTTIH